MRVGNTNRKEEKKRELLREVRFKKHCVDFLDEPNKTARLANSGSGTYCGEDLGFKDVRTLARHNCRDGERLFDDSYVARGPYLNLHLQGQEIAKAKQVPLEVKVDKEFMPSFKLGLEKGRKKAKKKAKWSKLRQFNKVRACPEQKVPVHVQTLKVKIRVRNKRPESGHGLVITQPAVPSVRGWSHFRRMNDNVLKNSSNGETVLRLRGGGEELDSETDSANDCEYLNSDTDTASEEGDNPIYDTEAATEGSATFTMDHTYCASVAPGLIEESDRVDDDEPTIRVERTSVIVTNPFFSQGETVNQERAHWKDINDINADDLNDTEMNHANMNAPDSTPKSTFENFYKCDPSQLRTDVQYKVITKTTGKKTVHCWASKIRFTNTHTTKNMKTFRCDIRGCNAFVKAITGENSLSCSTYQVCLEHNHDLDLSGWIIFKAKEKLKEMTISDFYRAPSHIFADFTTEYPCKLPLCEKSIFMDHWPSYHSIKQSMQRWRCEVRPPAPITQAGINLEGLDTVVGDDMDGEGNRIITFSSGILLDVFSETSRLNIDSTFKSAPKPDYASVMIIFAKVGGTWIPLTFSLLPNSGEETYRVAFTQIKQAVERRGQSFVDQCQVMMDFELAERDMYMEVIGDNYNHQLVGCTFHFGQAIIAYVRSSGFITEYREDSCSPLRTIIQMALGIPHVPIEDLDDLVQDMNDMNERNDMNYQNGDARGSEVSKFLDVFINKYIKGFWLNGSIPRSEFNFFSQDEDLTNNAAESGNNQLYSLLGRVPHRNFYDFHQIVKKRISYLEFVVQNLELQGARVIRSAASRKAEQVRLNLKSRFLHRMKVGFDRKIALRKLARAAGATTNRIITSTRKGNLSKKPSTMTEDIVDELDDDSEMNSNAELKRLRGRPKYQRKRAPSQKVCTFCGKFYARGYLKNHSRKCSSNPSVIRAKGSDEDDNVLDMDSILDEADDREIQDKQMYSGCLYVKVGTAVENIVDLVGSSRSVVGKGKKGLGSKSQTGKKIHDKNDAKYEKNMKDMNDKKDRNDTFPEGFHGVHQHHREQFPNVMVKTIPSSGGCCYASISWCLTRDPIHYETLRLDAHEFLISSWDLAGYDRWVTWPHKVIEVVTTGKAITFFISSKEEYFNYLLEERSLTAFTESEVELQNLSNLLNLNIEVFSYRINDNTQITRRYKPDINIGFFSRLWENDRNMTARLYHSIDNHFEVLVDVQPPYEDHDLVQPDARPDMPDNNPGGNISCGYQPLDWFRENRSMFNCRVEEPYFVNKYLQDLFEKCKRNNLDQVSRLDEKSFIFFSTEEMNTFLNQSQALGMCVSCASFQDKEGPDEEIFIEHFYYQIDLENERRESGLFDEFAHLDW